MQHDASVQCSAPQPIGNGSRMMLRHVYESVSQIVLLPLQYSSILPSQHCSLTSPAHTETELLTAICARTCDTTQPEHWCQCQDSFIVLGNESSGQVVTSDHHAAAHQGRGLHDAALMLLYHNGTYEGTTHRTVSKTAHRQNGGQHACS